MPQQIAWLAFICFPGSQQSPRVEATMTTWWRNDEVEVEVNENAIGIGNVGAVMI